MDDVIDKRKEYAKYRLERAKEEYDTSLILFESKYYRAANNRAYYSIFHGMRAVLAFNGFDSKKHSGIIAIFRKDYIKSGLFEERLSDIIGAASEIRNASDYDDMYIATREETDEQIKNAKIFLDTISKYVNQKLS